jgi:hypothetical protein
VCSKKRAKGMRRSDGRGGRQEEKGAGCQKKKNICAKEYIKRNVVLCLLSLKVFVPYFYSNVG